MSVAGSGLRQGVSRQDGWGAGQLLSAATLTIALAADHEHVTMVSEAVQGGAGQQVIIEDFIMPPFWIA